MTASEMREIAHKKGGFDSEVKRITSWLEQDIKKASENGKTSTYFCSAYKYENLDEYREVIKRFERNGFIFKIEQHVVGGVLQNPACYVRW